MGYQKDLKEAVSDAQMDDQENPQEMKPKFNMKSEILRLVDSEPWKVQGQAQKAFIHSIQERYQGWHQKFILVSDLVLGNSKDDSVKCLSKVPEIDKSFSPTTKLLAILV